MNIGHSLSYGSQAFAVQKIRLPRLPGTAILFDRGKFTGYP
jgi:hypothetical protein